MNAALSVSVIVPTCERPDLLNYCVSQILFQIDQIPTVIFEIIVCDDSRGLATKELIEQKYHHSVVYVKGPRSGPGGNRNAGAAVAKYPWIIFVDDDCRPDPGWLAGYVEAFSNAENGDHVFEGATFWDRAPESLLWEIVYNPHCNMHPSCNLAFRRSYYESMGGFDARFVRFQDMELSSRILHDRVSYLPVPKASVMHPIRKIKMKAFVARWEMRVIQAFDQGASPVFILWRLPYFALRVIQSRFRGQPISKENIQAVFLFSWEWLAATALTPGWILKWRKRPKGDYWAKNAKDTPITKNYGI